MRRPDRWGRRCWRDATRCQDAVPPTGHPWHAIGTHADRRPNGGRRARRRTTRCRPRWWDALRVRRPVATGVRGVDRSIGRRPRRSASSPRVTIRDSAVRVVPAVIPNSDVKSSNRPTGIDGGWVPSSTESTIERGLSGSSSTLRFVRSLIMAIVECNMNS